MPSSRIGLAISRRPVSLIAAMNGGYDGSCSSTASPGSLNAMTEEKLACTRSPIATVSAGSVCQPNRLSMRRTNAAASTPSRAA